MSDLPPGSHVDVPGTDNASGGSSATLQRSDVPASLRSLVVLEQQRIDSFNRRTEVVRYSIDANDAADKRQYDYQMAKLEVETVEAKSRNRLKQIVITSGIVTLGILLGMAFWGSPAQSDMALEVLKVLGIGAGGYGIIGGVTNLIRG